MLPPAEQRADVGLPPVVIAVAPNGSRLRPEDHPAVPLTASEIADDAAACLEAGASILHLHVRGAEQEHTLDPAAYAEAIAAVRDRAGSSLLIQITTEAGGRYSAREQMDVVRAVRPDAVSLAVRELSAAGEEVYACFLAELHERGALVQHILYDPADWRRLRAWERAGVVPEGSSVLVVLGDRDAAAEPAEVSRFEGVVASAQPWFVCAFGRRETACLLVAGAFGGHVRVGFENNRVMADGSIAADNAQRVREVAAAMRLVGRRVARPEEALALLGGERTPSPLGGASATGWDRAREARGARGGGG